MKPLPPANTLPGANWATSYTCAVCEIKDYDMKAMDLIQYFLDADGETVCEDCIKLVNLGRQK